MSGFKRTRRRPFSERPLAKVALKPKVALKKRPSFFQRHGRVFGFLGSLLILGTYVIKEVAQERLRSQIESIDRATQKYAIGVDEDSGNNIINNVETPLLTHLRTLSPDAVKDATSTRDLFNSLSVSRGELIRIFWHLLGFHNSSEKLAKFLPNPPVIVVGVAVGRDGFVTNPRADTELSREYWRWDRELKKMSFETMAVVNFEAQSRFVGPNRTHQFERTEVRSTLERYRNVMISHYIEAGQIRLWTNDLRRKMLSRCEEYSEDLSRRSRTCTEIGYFFYAIGWLLNAAGNWFGIKVMPSESE